MLLLLFNLILFSIFFVITEVESDSDDDDEKLQTSTTSEKNKNVPFEDKTFPEVAFAVDKAILREVEEMEEKVFTASLQVKVKNCLQFLCIETGASLFLAICISLWLMLL